MPMQVAAILGHELVHAAVGVAARHGKPFRRVAKGIGLVGQMAATTAGPEFEKVMRPILEGAGPLPHGRLQLAGAPAAIPADAKNRTLVRSSAPVALAAILFVPRSDGSISPGHRSVQSMVKWT
jgi:hypothetical protein